jgi:hypothetical protein
MQIRVGKWLKLYNVNFLYVTAVVYSDESTIFEEPGSDTGATIHGPGHHPLALVHDVPVRLGVPAGKEIARSATLGRASPATLSQFQNKEGDIKFDLKIEYKGLKPPPRSWSRLPGERVSIFQTLAFECTPKGDFEFKYKGVPKVKIPDRDLSVDIEVYHWKENPKRDTRVDDIPREVFEEWVKQMNIIHIEIIAKLTLTYGSGWISVSVKEGSSPDLSLPSDIKGDFSTGEDTAAFGPMRIDLEPVGAGPPITMPNGVSWPVYFGVGSADIDKIVEGPTGKKHQGQLLDERVREALSKHWDLREGLYYRKLKMRGEAVASATWRDAKPAELVRKNQELSQKRLDAIVNRLRKITAELPRHSGGGPFVPDTSEMKALGSTHGAKLGEETVNERACVITVDAADLTKAIRDLYGRKLRGRNRMPPPPFPTPQR